MIRIYALFHKLPLAREAVVELKHQQLARDLAVVTKDPLRESLNSFNLEPISDNLKGGAVLGGALGTIAGIIAGTAPLISITPGSLLVIGPLAALLGIAGGMAGIFAGGLARGLIATGVPISIANRYENQLKNGAVLLALSTQSPPQPVIDLLHQFQAEDIILQEQA